MFWTAYAAGMIDHEPIRARFVALKPHLDERSRRVLAAAEAKAAGYGGIAAVWRATGIAPSTIGRGLRELADGSGPPLGRVRHPGGGRKPLIETDPRLLDALLALVEPTTRGDPESPLRWTCKSVRRLAQASCRRRVTDQPHPGRRLAQGAGYSLQGNRKTRRATATPTGMRSSATSTSQVTTALAEQQPVISVDTKKKELVGDFKNGGREYRPQGNPEEVRVHDFLIKELGRAVPYGVYDLAANAGWVSVGIDHDTAAFAVNSIRRWWQTDRSGALSQRHPTADHRRWRRQQRLAGAAVETRIADSWPTRLGLDIAVSHLPPGTSKWNKIEHRLFSFISQNWRAKPLVSYRVIVELIAATTTKTGLTVRCELDTDQYPSGIVVSDAEMAAINIKRADFHGEWNYTISPTIAQIAQMIPELTLSASFVAWSHRSDQHF